MQVPFDLQLAPALDGATSPSVVGRRTSAPLPAWPSRQAAKSDASSDSGNGPRLGALLAGLSQALDLGEGRAPGHALRCCWIGQQIGRALGLNGVEMRELYYATLIKDSGGSATAARTTEFFASDDLGFKRDRASARANWAGIVKFGVAHIGRQSGPIARLCLLGRAWRSGAEVLRELADLRGMRGAQVARQLGFSDDVAEAVQCMDEQWDGGGLPQGLAGTEIPLYARIAKLAQIVDIAHTRAGAPATREEVARRSGSQLDPRLADTFAILARDAQFWAGLDTEDLARQVCELEPAASRQPVDADTLDNVAAVFGRIVDAKSAFTEGHSTRVAEVADRICTVLGLDVERRGWLRRAAWLHDIGKLGVSSAILDKPARLDPWEWAAMQRHTLLTERILGGIANFGSLARVACAHHEKLDGSGYPRGLDTRHIRLETRIVTTADVFDALTSERPQRAAMPVAQALRVMRESIGSTIDGDCFAALRRTLIGDAAAA